MNNCLGYFVVFYAGVMVGVAVLALFTGVGKGRVEGNPQEEDGTAGSDGMAEEDGDLTEMTGVATIRGGSMFRRTFGRLACWYRKNSNYRRSRKLSDHRAVARPQRDGYFRSIPEGALTGDPAAKGGR